MAHSFFHGYLKLVLPKTGDAEKNLEELMQDYEGKHGVKFKCYKLFILIPKSLYCPPTLMSEYSPSIEESKVRCVGSQGPINRKKNKWYKKVFLQSLEEKQLTVAGVQKRVYKNSVYKINSEDGQKFYVVAEYATPLKTFKDVVKYNGQHSSESFIMLYIFVIVVF